MRYIWGLVFIGLSLSATAGAHIELLEPTARHGRTELKSGPCGVTNSNRSQKISYFRPGATIVVRFSEYIDHPGHYRIAFDIDGDDVFENPRCLGECDNRNMQISVDQQPWILADGIQDRRATPNDDIYEVTVTLPNQECDNCTLQLIQVMTDKPPYNMDQPGGNDLYFACADLVLTNDAPEVSPPDPVEPPLPVDPVEPPLPPEPVEPPPDATPTPPSNGANQATPSSSSYGCRNTSPIELNLWIMVLIVGCLLRIRRSPKQA
ncbi:MAG: hypothetical protein KTR25_19055 [Myxococcales bacterium]|nr:hypothetical protein [Myxococcales bacterium]